MSEQNNWRKGYLPLPPNHGWRTTSPKNSLFVADRGAVQFEFPREWIILPPRNDSIMIQDKPYPEENMRFIVSVGQLMMGDGVGEGVPLRRLGESVEWGLPIDEAFMASRTKPDDELLEVGKLRLANSPSFEAAWRQVAYIDKEENRKLISRTCIARATSTCGVITLDFWPEYASRANRVWRLMLATLKIGEYIEDHTLSQKMN